MSSGDIEGSLEIKGINGRVDLGLVSESCSGWRYQRINFAGACDNSASAARASAVLMAESS